MTHIEAVTVIAILLQDNDEADRLESFMVQFPTHKATAREIWRDRFGQSWHGAASAPPRCKHERLNEDGTCRECGADKRGIGA